MNTGDTHRQYLHKANKYIMGNPHFYLTLSNINPNLISKEINTELSSYEKRVKTDTFAYQNINQETKNFLNSYYKIQNKKAKQTDKIKDEKLKSPFLDLINQYINRGYKIPDLSYKKNLFNPSLLLLDTSKVVKILEKKKEKSNISKNKDFFYLRKVDNLVGKERTKLKKKQKNDEHTRLNSFTYLNKEIREDNFAQKLPNQNMTNQNFFKLSEKHGEDEKNENKKNIHEENEKLKQYNDVIEKCIHSFEKDSFIAPRSRNITKHFNFNLMFSNPNSTTNKKVSDSHFMFSSVLTEPNNNTEIKHKKTIDLQKRKPKKLLSSFVKQSSLQKSYTKCIKIIKSKGNKNNQNISLPKTPSNTSESRMNYTTYYSDNGNSNFISLDFAKHNDPHKSSDLLNLIEKAKKNINNYNFDNVKKIAVTRDKVRGTEYAEKIVSLDKEIMSLDKRLIKTIEKSKE